MSDLILVNEEFFGGRQIQTVNARDLHAYLGIGRDFNTWIKSRIEQYGFEEDVDFVVFSPVSGKTPSVGRPTVEYHISLDMGKELAMVERNDKGREVRRYFIECERRLREESVPAIPKSYADALRALAENVEQKALAEAERDEAVRTKAHISDKKTATAMATASAAVRKVRALEDELGRGASWKTVKSLHWVEDYFIPSQGMWSVLGRTLTSYSKGAGFPVKRVESEQFGQVNAYHVDVLAKFRKHLDMDANIMAKYRRDRTAA
jgi:phage anti-repressor protein